MLHCVPSFRLLYLKFARHEVLVYTLEHSKQVICILYQIITQCYSLHITYFDDSDVCDQLVLVLLLLLLTVALGPIIVVSLLLVFGLLKAELLLVALNLFVHGGILDRVHGLVSHLVGVVKTVAELYVLLVHGFDKVHEVVIDYRQNYGLLVVEQTLEPLLKIIFVAELSLVLLLFQFSHLKVEALDLSLRVFGLLF